MAIISSIREYLVKFRTSGTGELNKTASILTGLDAQLETSTKTISDLDRNLKGSAKATSNTTKEFAKMTQGLGGLVHVYAVVASNIFATTSAFNALRAASQKSALEESMVALSTATGVASRSIVADLQKISEGTLSATTAMQTVANSLPAGLSGQQLKDLTKIAIDASKVMGRDAADSVDRLTRGIIRLQPALLDDLGIVTRVDDAVRDYAGTLGKTVKDLSAFEKRVAFANAVIEEGTLKFSNLSGQMTVNPYDKIATDFQSFASNIGSSVAKIVQPFLSGLLNSTAASMVAAFTLFNTFMMKVVPSTLTRVQEQYSEVQDSLVRRAKEIQTLSSEVAEEIDAIPSVRVAKEAADKAREEVTKSLKEAQDIIGRKRKPIELEVAGTTVPAKDLLNKKNIFSSKELEAQLTASTAKLVELQAELEGANKKQTRDINSQIEAHQKINELIRARIAANEANTKASREQTKAVTETVHSYKVLKSIQDAEERMSIRLDAQRKVAHLADASQFGAAMKGIWGLARDNKGNPIDLVDPESFTESFRSLKMFSERVSLTGTLITTSVQKAMAIFSRFNMVLGVVTAAIALVSAGVTKYKESIGLSTEKTKLAEESYGKFTKVLEDLSKTQERYNGLIERGFFSDALILRAQTFITITQEATNAINEQIAAIKERNDPKWGKSFLGGMEMAQRSRQRANLKTLETAVVPTLEKTIQEIYTRSGETAAKEYMESIAQGSRLFTFNVDDKGIVKVKAAVGGLKNISDEAATAVQRAFEAANVSFIENIVEQKEGVQSISNVLKEAAKEQQQNMMSIFSGSALSKVHGQLDTVAKDVNKVIEASGGLAGIQEDEALAILEKLKGMETFAETNLGKTSAKVWKELGGLVSDIKAKREEVRRLEGEQNLNVAERINRDLLSRGVDAADEQIQEKVQAAVYNIETYKNRQGTLLGRLQGDLFKETTAEILKSIGFSTEAIEGLYATIYRKSGEQLKQARGELATLESGLSGAVGNASTTLKGLSEEALNLMMSEVGAKQEQQKISNNIQLLEKKNSAELQSQATLSKAKVALAVQALRVQEANWEITKATMLEEEKLDPRRKGILALKTSEHAIQVASLTNAIAIAKEEAAYREELARTVITAESLEKLYAKYPSQWREINSLIEQTNASLKFQEELQLSALQAAEARAKAEIDIREVVRDKLTSEEESPLRKLQDIKAAQIRAAAVINAEADNAVKEAQRRIDSVRVEQGQEGLKVKQDAERSKIQAEENRIIKLTQLELDKRKERIDQEYELLKLQMKEVPETWEAAGYKLKQSVGLLGQRFREDIKNSVGYVAGMTKVLGDTIDSAADALIDAIVQGKDIFKSIGEALRTTLLSSLTDMAKDLLKSNLKKLMLTSVEALSKLPGGEKLASVGALLKDPQEKTAENTAASVLATRDLANEAKVSSSIISDSVLRNVAATNKLELILLNIDKNISAMASCGCPGIEAKPVDLSALENLKLPTAQPVIELNKKPAETLPNTTNNETRGVVDASGKAVVSGLGSLYNVMDSVLTGISKLVLKTGQGFADLIFATKSKQETQPVLEHVKTRELPKINLEEVTRGIKEASTQTYSSNKSVEASTRATQTKLDELSASLALAKQETSTRQMYPALQKVQIDTLPPIDLKNQMVALSKADVSASIKEALNTTLKTEDPLAATKVAEQTEAAKVAKEQAQLGQNTTNSILTSIKETLGYIKDSFAKLGTAEPTTEVSNLVNKPVGGAVQTNSVAESVAGPKARTPFGDKSVVTMDSKDAKVAADQKSLLDKVRESIGLGTKTSKEGNEEISSILMGIKSGLLTAMVSGGDPKKALGSTVLGTIGSAIGSIWGPTGAALGGQLGGLLGSSFEKGGVMSNAGEIPLRKYARGGIADSPQLAMFGEGSKPEAYVPLPDGRSIPVAMQGGGATNNVSVNVAIDSRGQAQTEVSSGDMKQQGTRLGVLLSNAVQLELIAQQRPGGILYRR